MLQVLANMLYLCHSFGELCHSSLQSELYSCAVASLVHKVFCFVEMLDRIFFCPKHPTVHLFHNLEI